MVNPINNTPLLPATATGVITGNVPIADNLAAENALPANPASIVELSEQAQTLLQATNATQAGLTQTESAQASILQTEQDDAQLFQQNFEQLAAQSAQAETMLTQDLAAAQLSALDTTEATVTNQALQSALADAALNEAIATTTTSVTPEAATAAPLINLNTTNSITPTAVASTTTNTAANTANAQATTAEEAAIAAEANTAEQFMIATTAVETTPVTDPTIAAAIAAYRVNDTMLAEGEPLDEQAPPEMDMDVEAIVEIQDGKVDLHDSARDEPLHGAAWNWQRIVPIQRKNGKA